MGWDGMLTGHHRSGLSRFGNGACCCGGGGAEVRGCLCMWVWDGVRWGVRCDCGCSEEGGGRSRGGGGDGGGMVVGGGLGR